MPLLRVERITKSFGGLVALREIDFDVEEGEIFAIIGPNGSGKTTLFNIIAGYYKPDSGRIMLDGVDITGLRPHDICRRGIARTWQTVRPFSSMTVLENLVVARRFGGKDGSKSTYPRSEEILDMVGLSSKKDIPAANLSLPELRRLEIGRALATQPKILLLDEVMAGLNPSETSDAVNLIRTISRRSALAAVIVEHVMKAVVGLAEKGLVLHHGQKIAEGKIYDVLRDVQVIQAYLGSKASTQLDVKGNT